MNHLTILTRCWRWLRVISPMEYAVASAVMFRLIFWGFSLFPRLLVNSPSAVHEAEETLRIVEVFFLLCVCIIAGIYGIVRVVCFHPLCLEKYARSLKQFPWRPGKPFPNGPVAPQLQDVFWIALLGLIVCPISPAWWWGIAPPAIAVSCYTLALASVLRSTGPYWTGYAVAILFLLLITSMLRLVVGPLWSQVVLQGRPDLIGEFTPVGDNALWIQFGLLVSLLAGAIAVVSVVGYRQHISRLLEREILFSITESAKNPGRTRTDRMPKQPVMEDAGWPLNGISHKASVASARLPIEIVFISLTYAIFVFVFFDVITVKNSTFSDVSGIPEFRWLLNFSPALGSFPIFVFAAIYNIQLMTSCAPPISFWGRIRTGHWSIPRYDSIGRPLLLILLITVLGTTISLTLWQHPLLAAVTSFCAALVCSLAPPNRESWRLTGQYRLVPGKSLPIAGKPRVWMWR